MSEIFKFLNKLQKNNNREWFTDHKNEFEIAKTEANVIFESVYQELATKDELEPLKIYRIYRDVRFSLDKTPYKNHFSAQTGRKKPYKRGGYYIHFEQNNCFVAAGFWGPERNDLLRIRKDIDISNELVEILKIKELKSAFGELVGDEVKTAPKGFSKDHERINLLRKKQYIFVKKFTEDEVLANDFPKKVANAFSSLKPFFDYMTEVLTTDENGEPIV